MVISMNLNKIVLYLRSMIYLFGQIVSTLVIGTLIFPCIFIPSLPRARIISIWARFNIWTLKWICRIHYRVHGLNNIPDSPSIIMSNHQSAWETLCFQLVFPPQSYILKKELLWIPFFGWGLALNRPIALNRKKKDIKLLIKEGKQRLNEGRWLVVFPEGMRMKSGKLGMFQIGGAAIASKHGAPVLPVAHNAGLFWSKNSFLKYPGVVDICVGSLIKSEGKTPKEINALAKSSINDLLKTLPSSR